MCASEKIITVDTLWVELRSDAFMQRRRKEVAARACRHYKPCAHTAWCASMEKYTYSTIRRERKLRGGTATPIELYREHSFSCRILVMTWHSALLPEPLAPPTGPCLFNLSVIIFIIQMSSLTPRKCPFASRVSMFCAVRCVRSKPGELPRGLTEEDAEHVFM